MVRAIFDVNPEIGRLEMRVQGHAGFDEMGKDPVCAGASVLAMAAAQCIELMGQAGRLRKEPRVTVSGGNVRVVCNPKPECFDEAALILSVAHVGMLMLAETYPGYAEVKVIGPAEAVSIEESSTSRTD